MKKIKAFIIIGLYILSLMPYIIYISIVTIIYFILWVIARLLTKIFSIWK